MAANDARMEKAPWVRVAIPLGLLGRLIEPVVLCAADVGCLDGASKAAVQQLCLSRCAKCLWPAGMVPIYVEASADREDPSRGYDGGRQCPRRSVGRRLRIDGPSAASVQTP